MPKTSARFHALDYLRGMAAFSIMLYHYFRDSFGVLSSDTILGRVGIYGVSIFYVLSGLTLYLVYQKGAQMPVGDFFIKRLFRILPLFWLAIVFDSVLKARYPVFGWPLVLNLTGLFGFVDSNYSMVPGGWSIGNEMCFYSLFPLLLFAAKKSKLLFFLLLSGALVFYLWFAFFRIDPSTDKWWLEYINTLNQVFLFVSGIFMGRFLTKTIATRNNLLLLLVCILAFIFYPAHGDQGQLVVASNRLVFTALVFLICFCFFKWNIALPYFLHKPLSILGEASYSVYLLHWLVWELVGDIITSPVAKITVCILLTISLSYFIYQYFEKRFIRMGQLVCQNYPMKRYFSFKMGG